MTRIHHALARAIHSCLSCEHGRIQFDNTSVFTVNLGYIYNEKWFFYIFANKRVQWLGDIALNSGILCAKRIIHLSIQGLYLQHVSKTQHGPRGLHHHSLSREKHSFELVDPEQDTDKCPLESTLNTVAKDIRQISMLWTFLQLEVTYPCMLHSHHL